MKKLLILGAALLSLCAVGQTTARAGGDYRDDRDDRHYSRSDDDDCPPRRCYEGRVVEREYCPPPARVFLPLPPIPFVQVYHHRRHSYHPYAYGRGYRPGLRIGIGF